MEKRARATNIAHFKIYGSLSSHYKRANLIVGLKVDKTKLYIRGGVDSYCIRF